MKKIAALSILKNQQNQLEMHVKCLNPDGALLCLSIKGMIQSIY